MVMEEEEMVMGDGGGAVERLSTVCACVYYSGDPYT